MAGRRRVQIDLDRVRALLADGFSVREIAGELGVNEDTLRSRMTSEGIEPPFAARVSKVEVQSIRDLAAQGLTRRIIAERLDMNLNTLQWRLTRFGIEVRKESPGVRYRASEAVADAEPVKPVCAAPPKPAEPSPLDRELAGTGGKYAALAVVAARHGLTSTQARARWHKLGLSVTVVK